MKLLYHMVLVNLGILLKTQFGGSHMILNISFLTINTFTQGIFHNKTNCNLPTTILHLEV
jgi:hypothetical protein